MEKIDLVKLDTAILYVQRIAEGYNPVTNEEADEDTVLNHPHVIRCMYFVKNVLEEVRRNDGKMVTTKQRTKKAGYLTEAYYAEVKKVSTMPTEKGKELGIYTEVRMFSTHAYLSVIYNQNAQEFIVKNLEAIVNGEVAE